MRTRTVIGLTAAAGAAAGGYAALIERNWFVLRRYEVPVLPAGAAPVRVLHISDAHLTPRREKMISWIRALNDLDPHLVVNTGDSIAHPLAVPFFFNALGPLLDRPGVFVLGSNDLYSPRPRNPARYLYKKNHGRYESEAPTLPWEKLRDGMTEAGWLDLDNQRGRLRIGGVDIAFAGVHDSHIARDRYADVAGPADPSAGLRIGVMHSPEPRLLDQFAADGYDLLLAGHTHGGQLCLPWYGTLVTNCGLDREYARGLHRYPVATLPADGHPAPTGPTANSPAPSGLIASSPAPSGSTPGGPAPSGPTARGPAASGPTASSPAPSIAAARGQVVSGAASGPTGSGPAASGAAMSGAAASGPAANGPAASEPAMSGAAMSGPTASGAAASRPWLHVSAGLGTSPWAPARFACRPEATLLTLIPR